MVVSPVPPSPRLFQILGVAIICAETTQPFLFPHRAGDLPRASRERVKSSGRLTHLWNKVPFGDLQ